MEVTLVPTLSSLQKSLLRDWLIATLNNEGLNNTQSFPLSSYVSLYVDKRPAKVNSGTWLVGTDSIYLAKPDQDCPLAERLPILLTLSQLCEPSEELTKACSSAITRYLLGEYRSLSTNLVVSTVPPSGIAFSTDNRVASLLGSEWMLPSGEVVDVSGPDWVVCASEVPVRVEPVVDVEFSAAPFGPAFPPTATTETTEFVVGQRVHWNGGGFGQHDGIISELPTPSRNFYSMTDVEGHSWTCAADQLTPLPIDSEYQFSVGQRVHWTNTDFGPHDGVITELPTPSYSRYLMRDDNNRTWHCGLHELRAI